MPPKAYTSHPTYRPKTAYKCSTTLPKPRIGQGRVGIRRKPKVTLPIPKTIQKPILPMPAPIPRTVQPLTGTVTQSQDSTLPQHHVPMALQPLVPPTPASITQPTILLYHEPFVRPPPRPPDVTAMKDNRKDLSDIDTDRKIEFEENSPIRKA